MFVFSCVYLTVFSTYCAVCDAAFAFDTLLVVDYTALAVTAKLISGLPAFKIFSWY